MKTSWEFAVGRWQKDGRAACCRAKKMEKLHGACKGPSLKTILWFMEGSALSFYRAWLWLEQACIEAVYLELAVFGASKCNQAGTLR